MDWRIIMNKLNLEDLILYETPTICEFIPFNFIQHLFSIYIANKVNKKNKRYEYRLKLYKKYGRIK